MMNIAYFLFQLIVIVLAMLGQGWHLLLFFAHLFPKWQDSIWRLLKLKWGKRKSKKVVCLFHWHSCTWLLHFYKLRFLIEFFFFFILWRHCYLATVTLLQFPWPELLHFLESVAHPNFISTHPDSSLAKPICTSL